MSPCSVAFYMFGMWNIFNIFVPNMNDFVFMMCCLICMTFNECPYLHIISFILCYTHYSKIEGPKAKIHLLTGIIQTLNWGYLNELELLPKCIICGRNLISIRYADNTVLMAQIKSLQNFLDKAVKEIRKKELSIVSK